MAQHWCDQSCFQGRRTRCTPSALLSALAEIRLTRLMVYDRDCGHSGPISFRSPSAKRWTHIAAFIDARVVSHASQHGWTMVTTASVRYLLSTGVTLNTSLIWQCHSEADSAPAPTQDRYGFIIYWTQYSTDQKRERVMVYVRIQVKTAMKNDGLEYEILYVD